METTHPDELDWEETERGDVHFRRKRLGRATDAADLGASLYEIPPGKRGWPYHYHTANAEAIHVLAGQGRLRGPDDERVTLEPGVYATFPTGPAGAHQIEATGDAPLRYLAVSTMVEPEVLRYPDSDKVGVMAGDPPGGDAEERLVSAYFRAADAVDYWTDES